MTPFHLMLLEVGVSTAAFLTPHFQGARYRVMSRYCVSWLVLTIVFLLYFDLTTDWNANQRYDWALVLGVLPTLSGIVLYFSLPSIHGLDENGPDTYAAAKRDN